MRRLGATQKHAGLHAARVGFEGRANLSIEGQWELTPSVKGTSPGWQYVSLRFSSRDRTRVTIDARLGFYRSTAVGTAWFDDLILVELGPTPSA